MDEEKFVYQDITTIGKYGNCTYIRVPSSLTKILPKGTKTAIIKMTVDDMQNGRIKIEVEDGQ